MSRDKKEDRHFWNGEKTGLKRQRRNTAILIVILLAAFSVLYVMQYRMQGKPAPDTGGVVRIQADGKEVHSMALDHEGEYTFRTQDGHYNVVTVRDQTVSVREADCKNQICVKTGQIRYPGEVIACLPHRLIITIE